MSTDYHRSARFDHRVHPRWAAMPWTKKARTSRRTSMLISWCVNNCQGDYSYDGLKAGFSFKDVRDATLFKLTWG